MTTDLVLNKKRILEGVEFRGSVSISGVPAGDRAIIRYRNPVASGVRFAFLELECAPVAAAFVFMGVTETLPAMTDAGGGIFRSVDGTLGGVIGKLETHTEPSASKGPFLPTNYFHSERAAADYNVKVDMHRSPIILNPGQGFVVHVDQDAVAMTSNALWYEF